MVGAPALEALAIAQTCAVSCCLRVACDPRRDGNLRCEAHANLLRLGARLFCMNVRADLLLDEALDLLPEERSAVAMALIDILEGSDDRVISQAWRAELLQRREQLRSGAVKASPWAETRARMTGL